MYNILQSYPSGGISKPDFITSMYTSHKLHFRYAQRLAEVNLAEGSISTEGIVMEFRDPKVRMLCPKGDTRIAPIETLNFGDYVKAELHVFRQVISRIVAEKAGCIDIKLISQLGWKPIHTLADCFERNIHTCL
jgi:hypothetical protein